jgi:DNA (cytosine-5)-methyltransferase 1
MLMSGFEVEAMDESPEVIDLFSGAGGLALGFRTAGCRIALAVDGDPIATDTFARNFATLQPDYPPQVLTGPDGDLGRVGIETIRVARRPDIVIGGPPCQGFSRLGRGKLDSLTDEGFEGDPRNKLYEQFLAAVAYWKPRAVVMENVPGMLSVAGTNYASIVTQELAQLEYRTGYALLNAVWYGVPQLRERLFFIGIRADLDRRPTPPPTTHDATLPEGYRRPYRTRETPLPFGGIWDWMEGEITVPSAQAALPAVTVREAIDDLPILTEHLSGTPLPKGDFRRPLPYRGEPHSAYARLMRHWPGLQVPAFISDHVTRRTPRDYETFRRMRHGDRYPAAKEIAEVRFQEALDQLRTECKAPAPESEGWRALRKEYVPPYDAEEFLEKWGKLRPDQPSWTVPAHLAKDSYSHIHPDSNQARMISVREAARLQSFPDGFRFSGNMGECFRQIGNAVPPLLAWAIASALLESINCPSLRPPALAVSPSSRDRTGPS